MGYKLSENLENGEKCYLLRLKKLVGFLSNEKKGERMKKTAVILSGGLGTRLRPFTNIIPKPLLPIGEKAILEIQIDALKKYRFERIILATNYKSQYIEHFFGDGNRYGVELIISKETEPLGTVGPLKLVTEYLNEPFLIMNGDVLTDLDFDKFYEFGNNRNSMLTIAIKEIVMPYSFGNISFDGEWVTGIVEKPDIITYALAGIYYMKPQILQYIPDGPYNMDALIKRMLANGQSITKYELEGYWLDVGRKDDYERAQQIYG